MSEVQNLTNFAEANWDNEVASSDIPVLVEFWAPWCSYCRRLTPIFEALAPRYSGKIKFGKVNVDEQRGLAMRFGILGIPTLKAFCSNRAIWERVGLLSESELISQVEMIAANYKTCVETSSIVIGASIKRPGTIEESILEMKTIAVVGLSKDPIKDSHSVAQYLMSRGYRIIPINPTATEILGEKVYPSLLDVPEAVARSIDVVDVFRP